MQDKGKLGFWDAAFIVAGSMIGSGIFIVSADMSRLVGSPFLLMMLWVVAGIMTLLGALAIGELASMFPHAGGQYVYLKEAYNPLTGFLYGWTLFLVVQSGTIAAVAMAFAKFTGVIVPFISDQNVWVLFGDFKVNAIQLLAIFSIGLLTVINAGGMVYGKWILRIFTFSKLFSLLLLVVLGILVYHHPLAWQFNLDNFWNHQTVFTEGKEEIARLPISGLGLMSAFGVALVGSLFSSDAWNNVTFISAEVKNPAKNVPRSLLIGTGTVILLYILVNISYLRLLPIQGMPGGETVFDRGIQFASEDRVGTAAATMIFGSVASSLMAILIMISTFGCNNGIVLSSVRVYQAMAKDNLFFKSLGSNNQNGVPGNALWLQFFWASCLCLSGKYGDLLDYVMFSVMLFYMLAIGAVIVFRVKKPEMDRPYRCPAYPVLPLLYILMAMAFCLNLLWNKPANTWPGLLIVFAGIPVYYLWKKTETKSQS